MRLYSMPHQRIQDYYENCLIISQLLLVETYVNFVVAESKLEKYLSENPPSEKNIPEAQQKLSESEKLLNDVLHSNPAVSI